MANEVIPAINELDEFEHGEAATSALFNAVWSRLNAELNKVRNAVVTATPEDVANSEVNKLIDAYGLNLYRPQGTANDIVGRVSNKYPDAAAINEMFRLQSLVGHASELNTINSTDAQRDLDNYTYNCQFAIKDAINAPNDPNTPEREGYVRVVAKDDNNLVQYFTRKGGDQFVRGRVGGGAFGAWKEVGKVVTDYGEVGSYVFAYIYRSNNSLIPGTVVAGSELRAASLYQEGAYSQGSVNLIRYGVASGMSGSWVTMGGDNQGFSSGAGRLNLFQRIS